MALLIQDDEEYIHDAIWNGMNNISGPCFKYNNETKLYHYSNSKYPNKNYKKTYDPLTKYPNIKRGDVVHFGDDNYRNNNKLIFDGIKLIPLDTNIDDYGSVPSEFKVGKEFKPRHWVENYAIDHNSIIFLEPDLFETIEFHTYKNNEIIGNINILDKNYKFIVDYCNEFNSDKFRNLINSDNVELIVNDTQIIIQSKNTPILDEEKYIIESNLDENYNIIRKILNNENDKLPIKSMWNHKLNYNEWFVNNYLITITVIDKDEKVIIPEIKKWIINKKPDCCIYDDVISTIYN